MRLMVGDDHGRLAEISISGLREPDSRHVPQQEAGHPLNELMVFQLTLLRTAFEQEMEECVRIGEQEHQQHIPHKSV